MTSLRRVTFATCLAAIVAFTTSSSVTAQAPTPPVPISTARAVDPTRSVTLPLPEYNRLLDLAARPSPAPLAAPVGAVLTTADLHVRVDRESAHGTFTLAGEVLREGLHRVELMTGSTLVNGSVSGRPLALVADRNTPAALVQDMGPFALTLEWGTPLVYQPGRASFALPVPPAGTARAVIDVPGDQAEVRLSKGVITRRATANGRTTVDVTLQPGTATDVSWSMRDSAPVAATREVRIVSDVFTLVTIGDSDVRMAALVDVSVLQGDPRAVTLRLPSGYEVTGLSGGTLDTSETRGESVVLTLTDPTLRKHQFLVSLERPHDTGSFSLDTAVVTLPDAQRERGEMAIEGIGTLELETTEKDGTHRMDVKELNPMLASMARAPLLAAFRYQRASSSTPGLTLNVKRFDDAGVLAAVADQGTATTMVTSEGRALTEVLLTVRNRAQPFLKVTLPTGATLASVQVAGESAKPVLGSDGIRIPLLRPGFRPAGPYEVSFVYLHGGTPLAKRGDLQMLLPKMDLPIGIVHWELFVPETYSVRVVDGNVLDRRMLDKLSPGWATYRVALPAAASAEAPSELARQSTRHMEAASGGIVANDIGVLSETLTVSGASPESARSVPREDEQRRPPSQNVLNLQRRAAGVLPIRIDVPRAGASHQFVKPLVVDQETTVTLRYKRR